MPNFPCFQIGAVATPLGTACKVEQLNAFLEKLRPSLYIADADLYSKIADVELPSLKRDVRFTFDRPVDRRDQMQYLAEIVCWCEIILTAIAETNSVAHLSIFRGRWRFN